MSLDQMRKDYSLAGLAKQDVDPDPVVQFGRWFAEANQSELPDWFEINAMTLATSDSGGQVSCRVVLLKGIDRGKFFFYTNYDSSKGQQIAANPQVALGMHWPHLQRQVRIEGTAAKAERGQSEDYFHSRPRDSQLGALVSGQSSVVSSRRQLESRMRELSARYEGQTIPCPDHWGGYEVTPRRFEFWQGRPSRLHDRINYRRSDDRWIIERLSP